MYGNKIASGGNVKKRTLAEMYGNNAGGLNVSSKPVGTQTGKKEEPKDNGGFFGGLGYLGEKLAVDLVSSLEGAVDYVGSGFAKLIGNDKWAEEIISEDWFGDWYSHPEEWFNPSDGWKIAGDVAGGIGTSIPALGIGIVTHGAALPTFAAAALPAAGRSTQKAYKKTGELGIQEFGYGLASGTVEGGLETVTNLIGMGTGTLIKSFSKSFAKEAGEAAVKEGLIKTVGKSFIGEAFEEGASEFLDPYIKRATYDGQAENATPDQIIYSGIIGGLSGAVMGGGGYGINTANSFIKGHKMTTKGGESEVFQTSDYILGKAQKDALDADIFKEIKETREKLTISLKSTGGKVETVAQKKMLGDLSRANVVGAMNMGVARRALNIVNNAPDIAKRLTELGYKDGEGNALSYTAEDLTKGYDPKNPSSIYKALKGNAQLRSLAVADAAGQLFLDTSKFTHATLTAQVVASKVDFDRFSRTASPKEIKAVSDALQIDSWQELTYDKFVEKLAAYIEGGGVNTAVKTNELKAKIKEAKPSEVFSDIPKGVFFNNDGVRRYNDGNIDIAISKEGDSYRLYDYQTDSLTDEMPKSEVNDILRSYNNEKLKVFEEAREQIRLIEERQKSLADIETYARDNISDFKKLSAPAQGQIVRIIENGRAKGVSDSDVLMYAKVAAHSGIDIQFDKEANYRGVKKDGSADYADGFYEAAKNRIVVNPEGQRGAERLLIHELDHAIRKSLGKNGATRIYFEAIKNVDQATRDKITKAYKKTAKPGESVAAIMDETNAYYAEQVLGNKYTLEKLVEAESSLKEKILSFFKGASEDYADVPKLSGAAKKYYRTYKKLFDEFSARNAENNAIEPFTNKNGSNVNENGVSDNVRTINGNNMSVSDRQHAFTNSNSGIAHDFLLQYDDELRSIIENRGDTIIDDYDKLKSTVKNAFENPDNKSTAFLGIIDTTTLQKIKDNIPNLPKELEGKLFKEGKQYSIAITMDSIRHMVDEKGLSETDIIDYIDKIADVIIDFDSVNFDYYIKGKNKTPGLLFKKSFSDGTIITFDLVSQNKRSLLMQTLYMESSDYQKKKSAKALPMQNASGKTSKTQVGQTPTVIIPENQKNVKGIDENSSDKQFALPLDVDNFVANGEEFATPTLSTVGKERMTYKEKAFSKDWIFTKKTSAYIHAVDEMFGIQVYLEKVGGAKNAKASIQSVRSAPHQAQTMIGSVQYDIFKGNAKSAKKAGEGLNEIFRPIEKQGEKVTKQFNDYLLHHLNVDRYNANEKMKRLQEDAVESLHKVQEEIGTYEARKKEHEKRIFELGDTSVDRKLKEGNKKTIEQIDEKLTKLRADEGELLLQMPMHAESELKLVEDRITVLIREEAGIKQEIFEAGNDKDSMNKKRELREKSREIAEELERENEFADKLKETLRLYGYSLKPVFNIEGRTFTKEESAEYISKYDSLHPEFKTTAEKVWKFSKNLNEMRVSSGLIARSFAQKMAAMYPHYVPAFKSQINNSAKSDEGISVSSTVKRAKGYNSNIMSVKESIASQVSQVARNGNINMLANKVYDIAVKTGDVKYVDIMLPEEDGAVRSEEGIDRPKPNTVSFFRDGKEYKMNVSDEIYLGFKGISEASAPHTNVFARAFNWLTDKYKKLVTSWSPAFMMRNAIRDMQDAGLNSKHPLLFAKSISKAWVEIANNSENWQTYRAYGGFSSTVFDSKGVKGDVGTRGFELLGISERIASGDKLSVKYVKYIKGLMKGVENINAVVEQVPRFAEYLASIQSGETIEQAIYNSAEVTTNFARRGATIKQLNSTIIPFLNPAIQGFDKMFRNFTDAARAGSGEEVAKAFGVLLTKAISIGMLPALFNSLMYDDDEDYKDLREEDKENNYLFKLPNGTFLKLPRGRVASVIAGFSNRTIKSVKGEDADWGGYVGNVVSQVTPVENLTRTILSPFMDVANNRTWYGTEIEGAQFDNVRPKDRYDESTSSIAIAIGQAINYSPKKIHYLIDQYSGVIGDFLLPATTKKAEKDFFSGNFTLDPVTSNKLSNEFYKIYDEAQYSKTDGSVKAHYQVKYLNKAKSAISEMYNEINAIQNSDLSNYQKLQQTRVLRIMINEAMKNAVRDFEEIGKAIDATENMGFDDSKTSDVNIRYAEITRKVYGSERALYEYNSTVYSNMSVLNTAGISFDTLYDYYFGTKNIESDKDREGKTIAGSKRAKVVKAIGELGVSPEERLLLICASGYTLKDGDIRGLSAERAKKRLLKYILNLKGVSAAEKAEIAEMCGFEVKNGKIIMNSQSGQSKDARRLPKLKI